jgi:hypothetical protein
MLVLSAACFPVIGAAVRTFRIAHEFGRNTLRFRATSNELARLVSKLERVSSPQAKLGVLRDAEKTLEAERREWMRLMIEAEWFG